jgi:hypothetical protein
MLMVLGAFSQDVPSYKKTEVLAGGDGGGERPYLAFPAVLDLGGDVLISYKRGLAHAADPGAELELLRLEGETGQVKTRATIAQLDGAIMQLGEWVRFPNGDIASYIDARKKGQPSRIGLRTVRSTDGGATFGPVERVGVVDGVEYGYAFEAVTHGQVTWMLVMTFTNLTGGTFSQPLPRVAGSVDVIRSEDSGKSWRFVRSVTRELGGAPINESSLARFGEGFLVTARGYDSKQWLMRTDGEFRVLQKVDLAKENTFIASHVGRPRLFTRDGAWYLLGRNVTAPKTPMRLSLFRFDPETLKITRHVVLDNSEGQKVADGYYAMPYWRESGGKTVFHIVTYKRCDGPAQIIRLTFAWQEVR